MIFIECTDAPAKGMTTRVTPDGCGMWDVDVTEPLAFGVRGPYPELSRTGIGFDDALDVLWDAENGAVSEASDWGSSQYEHA